jgi:hypothetical protein
VQGGSSTRRDAAVADGTPADALTPATVPWLHRLGVGDDLHEPLRERFGGRFVGRS